MAQHLKEGQVSTAYFQKLHRRRQASAKLRVLQTDRCELLEDPDFILTEFTSFYENLYAGFQSQDEKLQALLRVLDHTGPTLQPAQRALLHEEPLDQEITEVAGLLPKNKAPSRDALSADALVAGWPFFGASVQSFIHFAWNTRLILASFLQSAVADERLKGIRLRNGYCLITSLYTDDIALFLAIDRPSFNNLHALL
ncbi:hypothetical protein R1sor_008544 [Riccia sorocarpa]|uniref:Reverse transcriptase n=1 Tax=Riccia sorocarpa TaxID=122646 RepID=A0ABD3HTQ7_9MARC